MRGDLRNHIPNISNKGIQRRLCKPLDVFMHDFSETRETVANQVRTELAL